MKRDMEVIRAVLLAVEQADGPHSGSSHFQLEGYDPGITGYHVRLLKEAGYLKAEFVLGDPPQAIVKDLTWEGHEFLDAVRNTTVWQRVKKKVVSEGGSIPLSVLKALALQYTREAFGLPE